MIIRMRNKFNAHNIGEAFCIIIAILSTIIVLLWALSVPAQELNQRQLMEKAATAKVGDILSKYNNIEIYKADSGKLTSKIYATPQYDANGKSLIKYDEKTGKVISRNRYVKFIPDIATGKLEMKREVGNANIKEYWTVPDKNITKLSWTVETDAERIVEDDALIFLDSQGVELFRTPAPIAWDMDKKQVDLKVIFDGEVLTYEILEGVYKYPITIDPTITVGSDVKDFAATSDSYIVRDYTNATWTQNGYPQVGQSFLDLQYTVRRAGLSFNLSELPIGITITEATLTMLGRENHSTNDFDLYVVSSYYSNDASGYSKFFGRTVGDAHTSIILNNNWNSSSFSTGWNTITFNDSGIDSLNAHIGGTFKIHLISSNDYDNTPPSMAEEWLYFNDGIENNPYLSVTYTLLKYRTRTILYDKEPNYIWENGNRVPIWKP